MTDSEDILQRQLEQAYDKLRAGFKLGARQIIRVVMQTNPHSPDAWYLLAQAAFTPGEARRALSIALTLDEGGYWAHHTLTRLQARYPLDVVATGETQAGKSEARRAPPKKPAKPAQPSQPPPPAPPGTPLTAPSPPATQAEPLPWAASDAAATPVGDSLSWVEEVALTALGAESTLPTGVTPPAQQDEAAWADLVAQVNMPAASPTPPAPPEPAPLQPTPSPPHDAAPPQAAEQVSWDDEESEEKTSRRLPRPTFPRSRPGVTFTREQKKKLRDAEDALRFVVSKGTAVPLGRKKAEIEHAIAISVGLYREVLYTGAGEAKHWFDMATALELLADRIAVIAEGRVPRGYTPPGLEAVAETFEPVLDRPPDWQAVANLCYEIASACKEVIKLAQGRDRKLYEQAQAKWEAMKTALVELHPLL